MAFWKASKYPSAEPAALKSLARRRGLEETPHPTSSVGHPLPLGEGNICWAPLRAPRAYEPFFPLRGERVARNRRTHQPGRDG